MAPARKPFTWSVSKLNSFETCPRRLQMVELDKIFQEEPNPASKFGLDLHKALENYCRSEGETPMPPKMQTYQAIGDKVLALPGRKFYELKLALTSDLDPCQFFDRDAWFRCVVDVLISSDGGRRGATLDYKTGKIKDDPSQLELNALAMFAHYPKMETIEARYWWITKGGGFSKFSFSRGDLADAWRTYLPRVKRYQKAYETNDFPPRPSGLCRNYCPVKTCEHCG